MNYLGAAIFGAGLGVGFYILAPDSFLTPRWWFALLTIIILNWLSEAIGTHK